ncbi:hypothetical protein [Modestobacter sp. VKM Ac-2978]|uniref:hypothetical protein n=1 Tax=Modestobacter sp. VKM Ac-2978 TaxID=3004132 RepID=UPI0022AA740F|nr:hypothetical protein [Modestobacter sp. VKM Ac-2978]MCZ2850028.1 hypothetical protein [Modestobacter sp. VKM Ac-2978]
MTRLGDLREDETRRSAVLRWSALGLAALIAAWLAAEVWRDAGAFAFLLLGLPVVVCLVAVLTSRSRYARWVTWAAAAVVLGWSLVLGLGIGLFFLPVAFVLAAAAARDDPARQDPAGSRPLRR